SPGLPVFTTIRRPETWLPSVFRWMRRQSAVGEWRPFPGPAAILHTLTGDDYPTVVRDILEHSPGVCGRIQEQYVQAADVALRQENLTEELTAWLRANIEEVPTDAVRDLSLVNETRDVVKRQVPCDLPDQLKAEFLDSEREFTHQFWD
ncbi:MAG: hypothetical protein N2C14_21245, partial [Planctomycetales bacterium]